MNLQFDEHAIEDLKYWVEKDRKKALRILKLIEEVARAPFTGSGKPEPLKYVFQGCWSRRIDQEHRLVYRVNDQIIRILTCRYHY
jgi:toxin YoeB